MNPVALQLAKGGHIAPTSWGAFGPGWLWVQAQGDGGVTINTDPMTVGVDIGTTTVTLGAVTILTDPMVVDADLGTTTVTAGGLLITTDPMVVGIEMGVTSVATGVTILTTPMTLAVEMGVTSVIAGRQFIPAVECEIITLDPTCTLTILPVACLVQSLPVEGEVVDSYGQNH